MRCSYPSEVQEKPSKTMINGVPDIPDEFLQIKKDDKFFSRLLSKESSKGSEPSFRVLYYGGAAGSIPFTWESAPGTPKHTLFSDNALPPLTPPPSYQLNPRAETMRKNSKPKFWRSIFPRKSRKRIENDKLPISFSSSSSSSYSSSSRSLPSTPMNKHNGRRSNGMARSMSAVQFGVDDEDEHEQVATSPSSTLCFRGGGISHPLKYAMKRALLSIAGHGTS